MVSGTSARIPQPALDYVAELERSFSGISKLLRNQYVIYYQPQNQTRDGKFREIKVRLENVDGKTEVRAKAGYYAVPADADRAPR